ncbi:hypothetical protein F4818DRAFT_451955 [Hypoxylon cercidicola]|nr:hypothetical protein F4818DRAFT_451955 [Hypoxylon cercidicola]
MATEPTAIIGFSFKLPQNVEDDRSFWDMLEKRRNLMTEWPPSRATLGSLEDNGIGGLNTLRSRGGYFIAEDPALFDAPFFAITPAEAAAMDPQQRLVLESSYHAFENAGISVESLSGSATAVLAASFSADYLQMHAKDPDAMPRMLATGIASTMMPNRVSWYFNLRGPSAHIDTACSGSLTALDMACQSLCSGDATMALVIGANLLLSPENSIHLSNINVLSPDSTCYSFDHRANGYGRGEGLVAVLLKPLSMALNDGDMIRAVIRASGSNQDGRTPIITQPSMEAQEMLIRKVYRKAGLGFAATRYVEAHGTGTPTGDPIEVEAISRVFKDQWSTQDPLFVGSVKSNIGHVEGSSGLAGIVKAILALEKGIIPPNALFEKMNPRIEDFSDRVTIPTTSSSWPSIGIRRASVNSFGLGGSNTHVILDDAMHYLQDHGLVGNHNCAAHPLRVSSSSTNKPSPRLNGEEYAPHSKVRGRKIVVSKEGICEAASRGSAPPKLLVWSAANENAIHRLIQHYEPYFQTEIANNPEKLERLAYTLSNRRSQMPWRTYATIGGSCNGTSVVRQLPVANPSRSSNSPGTVFVFTGQGAQYTNMGSDLLRYAVFEKTLKQADKAFRSLGCQWSIFDTIQSEEHINLPEYSQPLCTALQIALVELLKSFHVSPATVVGHSSGEIAAAYAIGALSLESACKVAYFRGKSISELRRRSSIPGAMMSVGLSEDDFSTYISSIHPRIPKDQIYISCINSPSNCTVSGNDNLIDELKSQLEKDDSMGSLERTDDCNFTKLMVSSVTGLPVSPDILSRSQYWVDNLVCPVGFSDAVLTVVQQKPGLSLISHQANAFTDIIEIGPHSALRRPLQDTFRYAAVKTARYHTVISKHMSPLTSILNLAGQLFCHGHPVSVSDVNGHTSDKRPPPFLVDCPKYPFDHSRQFWAESRLSRDFRLRGGTAGLVLGRRAFDWNPLKPRWRTILSPDSFPWLEDHIIGGTTLLPGTAMLVMAIEAVHEISARNQDISGFHIKEAHFLSPIIIDGVVDGLTETELHLRRLQQSHEKDSNWFEITIFSYWRNAWDECFKAIIESQYEMAENEVDGSRGTQWEKKRILRHYNQSATSSASVVKPSTFYGFLQGTGIRYGESFQLLQEIQRSGFGSSTARINMSSLKGSDIVHPAILDAAIHLALLEVTKGLSESSPNLVPQKLFDAWISAKGWNCVQTQSIRASSSARMKGSRWEAVIHTLADDDSPLCSMQHLVLAPVSQSDTSIARSRALLHNIEWKPQLSSLNPQRLQMLCDFTSSEATGIDKSAVSVAFRDGERAMITTAYKVLQDLNWPDGFSNAPSHLKKLASSIIHLQKMHFSNWDVEEMIPDAIDVVWERIGAVRPEWSIFSIIANNLKDILRQQVDPLQLLFAGGHAEVFYSSMFSELCGKRFQTFVDLLSHENPSLRVLEVGAGTGGLTEHVLSVFGTLEEQSGTPKFAEYTYTDVSPAFFENARSKFRRFESRMSFKKLDIEHNFQDQGLDLSRGYDVIIAGSVLHVATDLTVTLKNIRQALKPEGYLINVESTVPGSACANVGFGVLPGWWQPSEEWRTYSPLLTESQWEQVLEDAEFSRNILTFRDNENDGSHIFSLMVSTATRSSQEKTSPGKTPGRFLIIHDNSEIQCAFAELMTRMLNAESAQATSITPEDVVISILDIGRPYLANISEKNFCALQKLMAVTKNLLWVTSSSVEDPSYPYYQATTGFIRALRAESFERRFRPEKVVGYIAKTELIVRDSCLTIGRLVEETGLNKRMNSLVSPRLRKEPLHSGPATTVTCKAPGLLDTLQFVDDPKYGMPLKSDEVEIKAISWALSFRDIFIALGRLPGEHMGFECGGIVTRLGPLDRSESKLQLGDRVFFCSPGCMRTHPRTDAENVFKIPDAVSFEESISALNPGITAYHALVNVARLQKGESILIHSAAGSTGQMAAWIANMIGANIFVTVGFKEKMQLLMEKFNIPQEHIFYSRKPSSFSKGIARFTEGRGVDAVLNSLSGAGLNASWECIAPYGRFVELGKADIMANSSLPMSGFAKNASFSAVDMHHICESNPSLMRTLITKVRDLLALGIVQNPTPLHSYQASHIEDAFRFMQSGTNTGRVIIRADESDIVPKFRRERTPWTFDANATYIIAGGLGGLGRSIIRWMVDRGAKHLVLLSRSGVNSEPARHVVEELVNRGASIAAPVCDVSSVDSLKAILTEYSLTMPRIKGCINAAMVLQDAMFEDMSYAQWQLAMKSKIDTSWNLHELLPRSLDFFILLSSLSGFYGSASQSNYAAGCTFQDSLARYRATRGEKALSIDVGWMRTVGIVAEKEEYRRVRHHARDMAPIEEEELLSLLEIYCDPTLPPLPPDKSQLLIGAITPQDFIAQGENPIPAVRTRMFAGFMSATNASTSESSHTLNNDAALFDQAKDPDQRTEVVVRALRHKLAKSLTVSINDVDSEKTLSDYGVDSLMAVELRNWIGKDFHANLTVLDIMGRVSISDIGGLVTKRATVLN